MSFTSLLYKIIAVCTLAAVIGGCTSTPTPPPPTTAPTVAATGAATSAAPTTPMPTIDRAPVLTRAAQTVVAYMTLNAPTVVPVTPTLAATMTATMTSTLAPTATATMAPTATVVYWTVTPTPGVYSCAVTSTTPSPTTTVKVNTAFNWSWVIQNTGLWAWGQHQADIKFVSGTILQTNGYLFDLPADVPPNASVTVTIAMKTPTSAGTYKASWEIVQEGAVVCTVPVSVNVTN